MLMAKPCTFHSHPTKNSYLADIPSLQDIYSFLYYRHLRSVTVGATKIWVWDKTSATLGTVRKMASWMEANHFRVVNRLMKKDFSSWQAMYVQTVMKSLGWVWPDTIDEMDAQWPRMLREALKIKVRVEWHLLKSNPFCRIHLRRRLARRVGEFINRELRKSKDFVS
jgi:hypothetical protein